MNISIFKGRAVIDGTAAEFKPSPNIGGSLKPEYIVLHDTASGLNDGGSISWLINPASKVSAHVVVGRDGKITQLVPFNVKAWHAGQSVWRGRSLLNGFSVGIEIINPGRMTRIAPGVYKGVCTIDTNKDPSLVVKYAKTEVHGEGYWLAYSTEQVEAVRALCEALCHEYPIKEIVTHWLISPGRKVDPNPLYPLDDLRLVALGGAKPMGKPEAARTHAESDEAAGGGADSEHTTPADIHASQPASDESAGGVGSIWKLLKSKIAWASSALGGISLTSLTGILSDWRIVAILMGGTIILVALILFERNRKP